MATEAERPPARMAAATRRRTGRRHSDTGSTWLMLAPAIAILIVFFFAPLYYVFAYSTGMRTFAANAALAELNGELTSFSLDIWRDFLGRNVQLEFVGSASIDMPFWAMAIILTVLIIGVVAGSRVREYGNWIVGGGVVLLLLPFLTIPAGSNLLRIAEIQSADSSYLRLFFKSITLALTTSVFAVLIAFPIAYFLAFCLNKSKYTWLIIVIAPFLTSYLLRIFAWKVILGDQGLINSALFATGLRADGDPLTFLIYSEFTVIVVLMYAWVPFVCLPIFIALENMDRRLLEAATDLGASRLQAFRKVTLPIAAPGIVAAFLFVFIPSIGEFITPNLVGGTAGFMFGNAVANQFVGGTTDWQTGSVLALFLLVVVLGLTAATTKFLRQGGGA
jgi:spermidine/putrescine transport system permease protein